jgi:hypothetical protein
MFLVFNYALCHKDIWVSLGIVPPFLTSALDGGEWLVLRHGRFVTREIAHATHWLGGWVGPRAGLDAVERRRIFNPGRLACSLSLYRLSYPESFSGKYAVKKGKFVPVLN